MSHAKATGTIGIVARVAGTIDKDRHMSRCLTVAILMLMVAACALREQQTCYKTVVVEPHEANARYLAVTPCPPEQEG